MKLFEANIATIIERFFLMMAIVIASVFTHQFWAVGIALIIFMSALLGVRFEHFFTKHKH
ncbi:MAG: hypothetical protein KDC57_16150 [Saprospiraceae bacterium]|nr:hypothetical protein [Saprospiraceae bacterium]